MLLKNAKVCKNMLKLMEQNYSSNVGHDISPLGGIKKADGTYINTVYESGSYCMGGYYNRFFDYTKPTTQSFNPLGANTLSNNATFDIQLGSGNTAPTENDYKLASTYSLNTNFKPLTKSSTVTVKGDNSGVIFTMEQHFQAVTALTIAEIGLSNTIPSSSYNYSWQNVLLTRDVLSTPLSVSAGRGFTLRVSVEQPFSEI
jgi:hypothetical protein